MWGSGACHAVGLLSVPTPNGPSHLLGVHNGAPAPSFLGIVLRAHGARPAHHEHRDHGHCHHLGLKTGIPWPTAEQAPGPLPTLHLSQKSMEAPASAALTFLDILSLASGSRTLLQSWDTHPPGLNEVCLEPHHMKFLKLQKQYERLETDLEEVQVILEPSQLSSDYPQCSRGHGVGPGEAHSRRERDGWGSTQVGRSWRLRGMRGGHRGRGRKQLGRAGVRGHCPSPQEAAAGSQGLCASVRSAAPHHTAVHHRGVRGTLPGWVLI